MAGPVAADFFFLVIFLQGHQDAARDIAFGDHADQFVVLVHDRQAAQALLGEGFDGFDDGFVAGDRYHFAGHILRDRGREIVLLHRRTMSSRLTMPTSLSSSTTGQA
jgi:hypothetical protein